MSLDLLHVPPTGSLFYFPLQILNVLAFVTHEQIQNHSECPNPKSCVKKWSISQTHLLWVTYPEWVGESKGLPGTKDVIMVSKNIVGYGREGKAEWLMSCGERQI